jgi:ATP-dependent exoDNAse (exonuclease V) beta subunit
MQNTKFFKVNRSSAGSGKTYTLSLNFIALSLIGSVKYSKEYYRKILAITFTNKAASEMKNRVLEYLEVLSYGKNEDGVLDWIKKNTPLSEEQIIENAEKVKSSILHNYADLRISTIDKFTYNIVRTFSSDFDLSYNFELEMDNYKIIQPVVSNLISKMSSEGGEISEALVNFALQKAEDGKSTNIEKDLEEFSRNLFNESAIPFISSNSISVSDCLKVKDSLQNKKKQIVKNVRNHSDMVVKYFDAFGFTKDHFNSGTYFNLFTKHLQGSDESKWPPSDALLNNISQDKWYAKSKSDDIKDLVELHKNKLINFIDDLLVLIKDLNTTQSLLTNIYSIAVLNELLSEVNQYKKEQNIEQISVFNKKIHDVIVKQPSSFIYERIGERYNHFLIDEFQDTSLLQWQNLLPLITDSVDYGSCFIVGDGKQSIYRWRGGEVEQFIEIPDIFKGNKLKEKKEWESKLNTHYIEDESENQNYRSRKKIIEFNNLFFQHLKNNLSTNLSKIYDGCAQNSDYAKDGGYVHIELIDDQNEGFKENIIQKMISEINKLTSENEFNFKDITILCNSRKRVSLVAQIFSENNIPVVSNEGLLINSSERVRFLVDVMRYLLDKSDNLSKAAICEYLQSESPINYTLHEIHLLLKKEDGFIDLLNKYNISLPTEKFLRLPIYELTERLIKKFRIPENSYISFFLDVILKFSEKKGSNLSEFLLWWEEKKDSESIVVPEGTNAVQVMTIHKSKGLAFNVVMIPFNWEGGKKYSEIWVNASKQTNNKLNSTLIRGSKKLELSEFSNEYLNEKNLSFMDNLNKLYVAMTRPVERLYIFAKEYPSSISDSFLSSGKLNSFLHLYGISDIFIDGDSNEKHFEKVKKRPKVFSTTSTETIEWEKVVSLKRSSEKSWDLDNQSSGKDWGNLLHIALSRVNNTDEIDIVIDGLLSDGLCVWENKAKLKSELDRLLAHPDLQEFFDKKWEVKNEKEILTKEGSSYIPDRLLFSKNTTIILDYKTGSPDSSHNDQINNYAFILQQMGYANIEKYLIYTNDEQLVHRI